VQEIKVKDATECEFARSRAIPDNSNPDKTLTTQKKARCGIAARVPEAVDTGHFSCV